MIFYQLKWKIMARQGV